MAEGPVLVMSFSAGSCCLHCNDEHNRRTFVGSRHQQGLATHGQVVVKHVVHGRAVIHEIKRYFSHSSQTVGLCSCV